MLSKRLLIVPVLLIFIILFMTELIHADGVEYYGSWKSGNCKSIALDGTTMFTNRENYLDIVDCSDIGKPVHLSALSLPVSNIYDIAIDGNYAYVATWTDGLRIVDISDITNPVEIGYLNPDSAFAGVAVSGDYAYISDNYLGLRVINISDRTSPVQTAYYDSPGTARSVAIDGDYAYLVDGNYGLRIISISNPANPTEVGYYNDGTFTGSVAIAGNYAYVTNTYPMFVDSLLVIDISNPASPSRAGTAPTHGDATDVAVYGNYAYVADYDSGLVVFDISNPASPYEVFFEDDPYLVLKMAVSENCAYMVKTCGVQLYDITTPTSPMVASHYQTETGANGIAIRDNFVYIPEYYSTFKGLLVLDISNIFNPLQRALFEFDDSLGVPNDVALQGDYIYMSEGYEGMKVFDISDLDNIQLIGAIELPGCSQGIDVDNDYAYVITEDEGLRIIDISTPSNPTEITNISTGELPYDIELKDNYAFIADGASGLRVIDISTPSAPFQVDLLDTPNSASSVVLQDNYAFVADNTSLRIIDISTPSNLVEVGSYSGYYVQDVAISGDRAYLAHGPYPTGGMLVLDIASLSSPVQIGSYTAVLSTEIAMVDQTILLEEDGSIHFLGDTLATAIDDDIINLPEKTGLSQNYPNPFNAFTTINFNVTVSGHVSLKIFDLSGREVATLINGYQQAGSYSVQWDAGNYSSGIYFYCLKTGEHSDTKQMILLK